MLSVVFANSIAADMGLIPGLAIFGPALGLPLSVLAAFLERPFYSRAGIADDAIWYSLQANFISLIVGYMATLLVIPFVMSPVSEFAIIWPFLALAISILSELKYVQFRRPSDPIRWSSIAAANVFSSFACIAILVLAQWSRGQLPGLSNTLRPHQGAMNAVMAFACLALFAVSFAATSGRQVAPAASEPTGCAESAAHTESKQTSA